MGQIIAGVIAGVMLIAAFAGYIMNIIWLIGQDIIWNTEQVLSVLGIFMAPLGVLMGWMH